MHDDRHAQLFSVFSTLDHSFSICSRDVQIVTFNLTCLSLCLMNSLCNKLKTVSPAHERLTVDVLVIFCEIETTTKTLINSTTIVFGRQTQLRLDGTTQHWTTILIQLIALYLNTTWRPHAGLNKSNRETDVFQSQRTNRLKSEHVTDQGGQYINNRPLFKQIQGISDKHIESFFITRNVFNSVSTPFVVLHV